MEDIGGAAAGVYHGSLAQFFTVESEAAKLSKKEKDCLDQWRKLDGQSQELAMAYMEGLEARQNDKK